MSSTSIFSSHCNVSINPLIVDNIVLSGGGLLGIAYVGMLKYLEEINIIKNIKTISGCSAGSLFAVLISIGYTSDELYNIIIKLNFAEYIDITADRILNFTNSKGIDNGEKLLTLYKKLIYDKINSNTSLNTSSNNATNTTTTNTTSNNTITFKYIYDVYGIVLQICATNINTMKLGIFSYYNTPDLDIITAIKASISIPLLYEPVVINGYLYCDGGVISNLPIQLAYFSAKKTVTENMELNIKHKILEKTLGFYLTNEYNIIQKNTDIKDISIINYMDRIFQSFGNTKLNTIKKFHKNIVLIEISQEHMTLSKIYASIDDINKTIDSGYNMVKMQLDKCINLYSHASHVNKASTKIS